MYKPIAKYKNINPYQQITELQRYNNNNNKDLRMLT